MQLLDLREEGIIHLPMRQEDFTLLSGAEALATYTFNTDIAKHTFCRRCGIHSFYVPCSDPEDFSVNSRCLDGIDPATLVPTGFFDGRGSEAAMAARRATESRET